MISMNESRKYMIDLFNSILVKNKIDLFVYKTVKDLISGISFKILIIKYNQY